MEKNAWCTNNTNHVTADGHMAVNMLSIFFFNDLDSRN